MIATFADGVPPGGLIVCWVHGEHGGLVAPSGGLTVLCAGRGQRAGGAAWWTDCVL